MRAATIARNYAEALLVLAGRANDLDGWGVSINALATAMESDDRFRNFLAAPQISATEKNAVLGKAFGTKLPNGMVRFLQKLVQNRRQMLLPLIAIEYGNLVDETTGRIHAQVTLSRQASEADRVSLATQLSRVFAKTVVPHVDVRPEILGGVIVKVGDRVLDGSVRKRLRTLKARIVSAR
ncbi:MAG TPA: F0F1 ATP synthase subunit delta [Gemmatimonadaceae bacterium]